MTQVVKLNLRCAFCHRLMVEVQRECNYGPPHAHYRCPTATCMEPMDKLGEARGFAEPWAMCVHVKVNGQEGPSA